ncbi:MAG TPA: NAD-dependent epimerase/dehydratase family protein [Lacunisphaera sp.]|jgi:nucleoside-diphosphate-sugar epimerase
MSAPVFITGASGFIGGKIAVRLLEEGREVRVLARRPLPELAKLGAEVVLGDLTDVAALRRGCEGTGTVFHVAARVGVWGPPEDFLRVNVEGTRALIGACRAAGVSRLINTSSPSVVYTGGDLRGVNESAPLCTQAPSPYPTSKAEAERLVSAANSAELATVSLRPHLVWGPGDKNLIPRVVALARSGRLKIIGDGRNKVDLTHITNVVDAHLLAEKALTKSNLLGYSCPDAAGIGGRAYFITNGEPVMLWEWINELLRGAGTPEIKKRVSLNTASFGGGILEILWRILGLKGEPPMTRFVAKEMATDHWFDISAARRDFGYAPRVTMSEGTAELIQSLRSQ